jgi:hypothetical protein
MEEEGLSASGMHAVQVLVHAALTKRSICGDACWLQRKTCFQAKMCKATQAKQTGRGVSVHCMQALCAVECYK